MHTSLLIEIGLIVLALPVLAASAYLAILALWSRTRPAPPPRHDICFDVIVPAHNEVAGIERTVRSILECQYPNDRRRVLVVADNCTDATADVARAAGATVLERHDPLHRGKGYALSAAYRRSFLDGFAQAVVVVDADTLVSPNLLGSFAARFARGAAAVQAEYAVQSGDHWRGRLMKIAFTLFHTVRSLARERLALSCGLRGNGMGFTMAALARAPNNAYSLVEDVEYGLDLGLAGIRVQYVAEAWVASEMPVKGSVAAPQRARWEGGRRQLAKRRLRDLLRAAVSRRDPMLFDLAIDLAVPPLTSMVGVAGAGLVMSILVFHFGITSAAPVIAWAVACVMLVGYVGRGVALSGSGLRAIADLPWAVAYSLWKMVLAFTRRAAPATEWVRTTRDISERRRGI